MRNFKAIFLAIVIALSLPIFMEPKIVSAGSENKNHTTKDQKILMIIASKDFRDEEFLKPKEIFEKNGFKVVVASSSLNPSKGMLGTEVKPDILLGNVNLKDYKAVVFVGGVGAKEYFNNPVALKLAQDAERENKVIGAICIAPRILAEAGLLKGKKATVWSSETKEIEAKGAIYTWQDVEIDGNIVTASGPHAAEKFGKEIVTMILKQNK